MKFDPWNLSPKDLKDWAYTSGANHPDQDWELAVATCGNDELVLKFSEDQDCPNNEFMISCLYMIVGDFLHCGGGDSVRESEIEKLASKAISSRNEKVIEWSNKTIHILKNKGEFKYEKWCFV